MTTDIEQVGNALTEYSRVEAGLAVLRARHGSTVFDVTTGAGQDTAKDARAEIRALRYEIERIRKGAKTPLLALGKRIDAEAARITGELLKLEAPIDAQIKQEEERKERERAARVAAELARVTAINCRLAEITDLVVMAANASSSFVQKLIEELRARELTEAVFEEYLPNAERVRVETVDRIEELLPIAVQREADAAQATLDRAELARLRAENVARKKLEALAVAEHVAEHAELEDCETLMRNTPVHIPESMNRRIPDAIAIVVFVALHWEVDLDTAEQWCKALFKS